MVEEFGVKTGTVHFIYETTNLVNGMRYIGKHMSHDLLKDDYLGSGKRLKDAIKEFGRENFHRIIIAFNDSDESNSAMERELITPELLTSGLYYNKVPGGFGGVAMAACRTEAHFKIVGDKLRGRTKETHAGIAQAADKIRGRTKHTSPGVKAQSEKISGDGSPMKQPARRAHQSKCMMGENNPWYGKFGEASRHSKLLDVERDDIMKSFENGESRSSIAKRYQDKVATVTVLAIIKKAHRDGLISDEAITNAELNREGGTAKLTPLQRMEIISLFTWGMRPIDIATRYADLVTSKAIYSNIYRKDFYMAKYAKVAAAHGITFGTHDETVEPKIKSTTEDRREIINRYAQGETIKGITDSFGGRLSYKSVDAIIRRAIQRGELTKRVK